MLASLALAEESAQISFDSPQPGPKPVFFVSSGSVC
jgi:hypothetical protein